MEQSFTNLFEQAFKLKENMEELKSQLAVKRLQITAGKEEVILIVNGLQEVLEVVINIEGIPEPQRQRLGMLLKRAINQGIAKSREVAGQEAAKYTGFDPSFLDGMF